MGQRMVRMMVFQPPQPSISLKLLKECRLLPTKRGHGIPLLHLKCAGSRFVVVYSHGNGEDISAVYDWCSKLSSELKVDVVVYDYCGYGVRSDSVVPTEANVLADALDVADYALSYAATRGQRVVAFGRSLGSAPSIHVAAERPMGVCGLIIESGFTSCVRTQLNTPFTFWFDVFRNEERLPLCPQLTMVVHGRADCVVPFSHGQRLQAIAVAKGRAWCPSPESSDGVWFDGAGHNDIDADPDRAKELMHHLRHYLSRL